MGERSEFLELTDFEGDKVLIAREHIIAVEADDRTTPVVHEHQELDPDCLCTDCLGHPCDCGNWWSKSKVSIDMVTVEEIEEGHHMPVRMTYLVRESVRVISKRLGANRGIEQQEKLAFPKGMGR